MAEFRAGQILRADTLNAVAGIYAISEATAQPAFNVDSNWVDFPENDFPSISVTVPAGGKIRVNVSARAANNNFATSTCYLSWRAEGANTIADQFLYAVGRGGEGIAKASTIRTYVNLNGGDTLIVPQWRISSGGSSTSTLNNAFMEVWVLL